MTLPALFNLNTEQLFYLNLILITVSVSVLTILILRKSGKMRCMVLYPDLTYKIEFFKKEDSKGEPKLSFGTKKDKEEINFDPNDIFQERKSKIKFWRLPYRILLVNKATLETVHFKKSRKTKKQLAKQVGELGLWWTKESIQNWIDKKTAEAKARAKLFSRAELFLILGLLAINFFVVIMIAREVGAL